MNAIDTISYNLDLLHSQGNVGSTPSISLVSNLAPTVSSPLRLTSGTQVTGRTASVSALGADDKGETSLRYNWQTLSQPTGGLVSFASNGTNAAKNNVLTFNKPGTYEIRVSIQDQGGLITTSSLRINVVQTLANLRITTLSGIVVSSGSTIQTTEASQRLNVVGIDQFGSSMTALPKLSFTATSLPDGGSISTKLANGVVTVAFSRLGTYSIRARNDNTSFDFTANVVPTLTSISILTVDNRILTTGRPLTVERASEQLSAVARDQFGRPLASQPAINWTTVNVPTGGSATPSVSGNDVIFRFNQAGAYTVRAASGDREQIVTLDVVQTMSGITVTPGTITLTAGGQQQYRIQAVDQFQQAITTQPTAQWSATGGTINSAGLFTAGMVAGNFTVTARVGTVSNTAAIQLTASIALRNQALSNLVTSFYADGQLSRLEMIQILRSAGNDGTVDSTELTDLQFVVSNNSSFAMPSYVRTLARDVVNGNVANRMFKGQSAGNLFAGSSATLLNNLIDKWFLGADEPALTTSNLSYQTVVGNLFSTTPSRADAKQGMLGDCYFIASLASIADKNPEAVRNMFIDNGDDTYTTRFYVGAGFASGSGTADYVTVNRRLPAYLNGTLGYSSYGMSIGSQATPLWIAFAEKAYAQWNETGQSGRDGTNRYAAIEGGWMANVNAQVLGYNSSNYSFASSNKQSLISALSSSKSVTLGTLQNASAGGLVGSHAYTITGYNATTETFSLHNPWGVAHPTPLSWSQLQSNCSMFVTTDPAASVAVNQASVRNEFSPLLVGNWTIET